MTFSSGAAPQSASSLTLEKVRDARELLRGIVPVSRMVAADSLSSNSGARVFLKLECEGPMGSFKVRGAYHAIFRRKQTGALRGVVTSSTGNHGAAVAYAARQLGVPSHVAVVLNRTKFFSSFPIFAKISLPNCRGAKAVRPCVFS